MLIAQHTSYLSFLVLHHIFLACQTYTKKVRKFIKKNQIPKTPTNLLPNIDFRCFVAKQFSSRIYALFWRTFDRPKNAVVYQKWQIWGMHFCPYTFILSSPKRMLNPEREAANVEIYCNIYIHLANMISNLSPLLSKALFTSEFIWLWRVLSNHEIPFQALMVNLKTTNKENYRRKAKVICLENSCFHAPCLNSYTRP